MKKIFQNKIIVSSLFLLYVLIGQVYPYAHIHVHQAKKETRLEFQFHPAHTCPFSHRGVEHHDHEHEHFVGDWNHAPQNKQINTFFISHSLVFTFKDLISLSQKKLPIENDSPFFRQQFVTCKIVTRGPPCLS